MEPLQVVEGVAAPLVLNNIDTDQIIPGKELMKMESTGFAAGLFSEWRYRPGSREPDPDCILNRSPFDQACILLAGDNFACGSSREVAVWALRDFGIRCVIAQSFGGIFQANCYRNGVLPVVAPLPTIEAIAQRVTSGEPRVRVDLAAQSVTAGPLALRFTIGALHKDMLLRGLDALEPTLSREAEIAAFQARDRERRPWIWLESTEP
jgi:3-isopropylmalate/(R)-2-methylmalate dehydratase small subunit